jgi:hypothetical protein
MRSSRRMRASTSLPSPLYLGHNCVGANNHFQNLKYFWVGWHASLAETHLRELSQRRSGSCINSGGKSRLSSLAATMVSTEKRYLNKTLKTVCVQSKRDCLRT